MSTASPRHPLGRVRLAALTVSAVACSVAGIAIVGVSPASATTTDMSDIVINEVESNGDAVHGDWIELYNTGINVGDTVDLSGAILSDNDNSHKLLIPTGTSLGVGDYLAIRVDDPSVSGNFGLGAADSARLFEPGTSNLATATPIDAYSWTQHAPTTYGRNPDGTGDFEVTTSSTFGAANDFSTGTVGNISTVRLNEIESNGDPAGDWIELYNTGANPVDISGAILTDSDPAHQFVVPASTTIAGHGYASFVVDAAFGLGDTDAATLYAPGDVTETSPVDSFSWTHHATVTFGRVTPGTGAWAETSASTRGSLNQFAPGGVPSLTGVKINEVVTRGDDTHGDWIELKNTGSSTVDLTGAILSDDNDGHVFRIPGGTTLAASGGLAAFRVDDPLATGNFGLGDADSARLFKADALDLGTAPVVDHESWTQDAVHSWGLNGSGVWAQTNKATFGAANDFTSTVTPDITSVVLNEVESQPDAGDTHGDWVELLNTSSTAIDISGAVISDSDDAHAYAIPAGTTIAANGTYVVNIETAGGFGLGSDDAVRLYRAGKLPSHVDANGEPDIALDHFEWTAHATHTYIRTLSGFGAWAQSTGATYNLPN